MYFVYAIFHWLNFEEQQENFEINNISRCARLTRVKAAQFKFWSDRSRIAVFSFNYRHVIV